MTQQQLDIKRKLAALRYAEVCGNVALTARRFGISRQCFYIWKRAYEKHGEASLINKSPCPVNLTRATVVVVSSSRTAQATSPTFV